jgi:putative protease
MVLVAAAHQPLSDWRLREHLGRLGGTPFRLGTLRNRIEGAAILPVRELNRLRREAVARLEAARLRRGRWQLLPPVNPEPVPAAATRPAGDAAELIVLVRREDQLEVAMTLGIRTVYCEFEDPKKYRAAVARFRQRPATGAAGARIYAVPPRVTKPGEDWILRQVRSSEADGYLVRNADQLAFFGGGQCVGDYTLNVANSVAAGYFLRHYGLERVTASYDLNNGQLEDLVRGLDPTRLEVVVHQHMPMFHMEHCVFCAFLTRGTDYTDCGRPCDRQRLRLRDRVGAEHPVLADAGCRNTVFNAAAQTGAEYVSRLVALGVRHFRLEFLDEAPAVVDRTIRRYEDLLRGRISGTELWRELRLRHQLGVTRGSLDGRERPVTVL